MRNRRVYTILWSLFFMVIFCRLLPAEIPKFISYQGKLTDDTGQAVPDGNYDFTFTLYDNATAGTADWGPETQTSVPVSGGLYSVLLGVYTAIDINFNKDYWLEVQVKGPSDASFQTLSPRHRLVTSPYAFRAEYANKFSSATTTSKGIVEFAENNEDGAFLAVQANDDRLAGVANSVVNNPNTDQILQAQDSGIIPLIIKGKEGGDAPPGNADVFQIFDNEFTPKLAWRINEYGNMIASGARNITSTGTVSAYTLTNTTVTITGGDISGVSNITMDGTGELDFGTAVNDYLNANYVMQLTTGGVTSLHRHTGEDIFKTLDSAYDNGGAITVDSKDVVLNLSDSTNDWKLTIDNVTAQQIDDAISLSLIHI